MSKKVQLEGNFGGSREDVYPATMAEIVYTRDGKNLEEKIKETNAQLSQKANKNEVFTMANMGQDVKEAMTGGSVSVVGRNSILSENIVMEQVKERNTNFIKPVKNLFNKETVTVGYINSTTGQVSTSSSYVYTDYIPITNNLDYVTKWWRFIAVYDENYNLLTEQGLTCATPVGEETVVNFAVGRYVRLTVTSGSVNKQMFYVGTEFDSGIYYPYELEIPNLRKIKESDLENELISKLNTIGVSELNGKCILNFGDSIAYGAGNNGIGYADLIASKNNMVVHDYSKSGSTMSKVTDKEQIYTQIEQAYSEGHTAPDYVLFDGGVNDMFPGRTIGEILNGYNRTWDLNTFCGGFENVLHLMRTYWLGAKIIYVIPHNMNTRDEAIQKQVVDKAIEICNKWSIPYVDLYRHGGMNTNIIQHKLQYCGNSDGTHPNELGYTTFYVNPIETKMKSI